MESPHIGELDLIYGRSEHMVARKIAEEFILVPLVGRGADLDAIYSLSRVAAFIWDCLDGARTGRQVVEAVVERFDVSPDRASADYQELARDLLQIGAIEARPGA